jgi:hypothetical protein
MDVKKPKRRNKKPRIDFFSKSKEVHDDKYDYSKVNYINCTTPVTIICKIHGEFQQNPRSHMAKHSCPKCSNKHQHTTEEYIKLANKKHNNKYNYSETKYVNTNTKIKIICPIHGEFEQNASNHLQGGECAKCVGKYIPTTEEWILKAKKNTWK